MSQNRTPVPRLDLAPKLKRPLSLWNPLDYLRLLYWVFFFPQALRWYEDKFGGGFVVYTQITWQKRWQLVRQNSIQFQFFLQGLVLTLVTPIILGLIFQTIAIPLDWFGLGLGIVGSIAFALMFGVSLGVGFSLVGGVGFGIGLSVVSGLWSGVALKMGFGVESDVAGWLLYLLVVRGITLGAALGIGLSVGLGVALSVGSRAPDNVVSDETNKAVSDGAQFVNVSKLLWVALVASAVLMGDAAAIVERLTQAVIFLVAFAAGLVAVLRPDTWLFGLLFGLRISQNGRSQFPHLALLPLPFLSNRLTNWLRRDWESGLHNANQILAYSLQFTPVIQAVNRVLAETPLDQVIFRVAQLAEEPHHRRLVYSVSASLSETIKLTDSATRLDTPARAAAAGFWYLYKDEPEKAVEAFAVVRSLPYAEEMYSLAQTLVAFYNAKELGAIANLHLPAFPEQPLRRQSTWETFASLYRVIEDVQVVERSVSVTARALALNRALGELSEFPNKIKTLPEAEKGLIAKIAVSWIEALLKIATEVGQISINEPVRNPYVVGDPVEGQLFVGREDVMKRLKELWVSANQVQSVVLYGHRRMGKTSILKNVVNRLGPGVKVAYINLLTLATISQGVGEVLMAICDEISRTVNLPPPADADLLNLPERTFERYLKQVEANLTCGLIIALDEFEEIETLIEADKIPKDFMKFLRGMVQMSPRIAFALAGLHTLEEMIADYFQPFFASVIPIKVSFIERAPTGYLLANPDEDFPLDYEPEALDLIYQLTAGQPYLVQLIGSELVNYYKDQVFEMGRPREPFFTVDDVETVINDPEFFNRGRYYFTGVWGEAAKAAVHQQAILKALAPHPEGLSLAALAETAGIDETTLGEALKTLTRHDVVKENESRWRIIVELFRRWVLDYA